MKEEYFEWECTHSAWFLACPILIADVDGEAPTPVPRWSWLFPWMELQFDIHNAVAWLMGTLFGLELPYMFWLVSPLPSPRTVKVKAEEQE